MMKEEPPAVSIIMSVLNEAPFLRQCLDSIRRQTFTAWELVVCDDGSCDGSAAVLNEYAEKDNRIKIIGNRERLGLSSALNRCFEQSRGALIARMDGDDICAPKRLQKQAAFLNSHSEYAFVGCALTLFDSRGPWGRRFYQQNPDKWSFAYNSPFAHPSLMIRRGALREAGGYAEEKLFERSQDYWLFMNLYAIGYKGANLSEPLHFYREDRYYNAKRKYYYRLQEAATRYYGFRRLGLWPAALPFVIKPLLAGIIPAPVLCRLRGDILFDEKNKSFAGRRRDGAAGSRDCADESLPLY